MRQLLEMRAVPGRNGTQHGRILQLFGDALEDTVLAEIRQLSSKEEDSPTPPPIPFEKKWERWVLWSHGGVRAGRLHPPAAPALSSRGAGECRQGVLREEQPGSACCTLFENLARKANVACLP